jgi:hypothetical protein
MTGTIIGKRLLLNEVDNDGNVYPNVDIRYGPYTSVEEAVQALTENNWLTPFLTVGIIDKGNIKEYWINANKELVDKSTNTIVNNIISKEQNAEDNNTEQLIESIQTKLNLIESNCKGINDSIDIEGIKNNFKNLLKMIDNNKIAITVVNTNINTITDKIQQIEKFIYNYDSYTKEELNSRFNSYRMSVNNINSVLTKHEKLHEKRFDDIINLSNKINDINENIHNIEDIIEKNNSKITLIEKDIKDIKFNIQYITNLYNSIKDVNEKVNNFIIDYSNKIDELNTKMISSVKDIVKIENELSDVNFIKKDNVLTCNLQLSKCYILNWQNNDIDTIKLIVGKNIGKYKFEYNIIIYGNNYKLLFDNVIFNKNDIPILLKNTITSITIDNVTKIATYKQINNN